MKLDHKLGESPLFIASTLVEEGGTINPPTTPLLSEAIHVNGCGYEAKTDWGKEVATSLRRFLEPDWTHDHFKTGRFQL